jgi:UDP-N-acetylmuramoyl-L-alanyl-D-glutamate--2,6-diaminopimelate ligase
MPTGNRIMKVLTSRRENGEKLSRSDARPILDCDGMELKDLLVGAGALELPAGRDIEISSVAYDSRRVSQGSLFVAIDGEITNGNRFITSALDRGATAIVSELPPPPGPAWDALSSQVGAAHAGSVASPTAIPPSVAWVRVPDARKAMATIAANFFGRPAEKLALIGITGTNGKTTTSFLLDSIVRAAGRQSGLFGTIAYRTPRGTRPATTTTPESLDLQGFLAEVVNAGGTHAVLEASSHALALDRVWGCHFAAAVFTNLTRDHLDFHHTFEEYFAAKRRLFEGTGEGAPDAGIINVDDAYGHRLVGLARRTITYGLTPGAQVTAKKFSLGFSGLEFIAETPQGKIEVHSRLVGRINVYNLLAAIATSVSLGFSRQAIEEGIRQLDSVPGRFERIDLGQPFLVIVDYAHTDDALRNLLATARELHPTGRIITLFGCGGDRDRSKRPLMGEAAGRMSQVVVLTSDNPRGEDPRNIINDALVGLQRTSAKLLVEPDRERAIGLALDEARSGDIVLLAGKGHETTQVLKDRVLDFDDREMARKFLRLRGYGG